MTKVLVTDYTFDSLDIEMGILQPLGCQVIARQCKNPAELIDQVGDADQVITQFAPVNAQVIAAMRRARVIVRYGIGVDNVDVDAARARRIPVCNVPDYCIDEVADHTLAFMLAATRQVVANSNGVTSGTWAIVVIQTDDPAFNAWARAIAERNRHLDRPPRPVVLVHIRELRPAQSRIVRAEAELLKA